ncbi:Major Facilitator Superfamily transporter [Mycolicibacterium chubuense NBB4]|uniref:Major Facilitator Superfamily transporter n=1 Tax=Mycolicibacterium chubuense (strain NBB4) TaxID=710421 RepID=I4BIB3_MYCCN|nr:Major Facilitator Superfamily transporter [Mycolicibacterium chubuense NBB4]
MITAPRHSARDRLKPWHFVLLFGTVSLLADTVYEGARSIIGPYLATLGASAALVGLVAGAGEFIGYSLRVVSGYAIARTQHYWAWTIAGYALTVLSVPLIGVSGALVPALLLYGTERLGKAVRSPAKDTLLSHASTTTGRGSAFGVHQALDQTGAIAGPLLLAAVLSAYTGDYRLAFGVLIIPGLLVLLLLGWLRFRVPDPRGYEEEDQPDTTTPASPDAAAAPLPTAASRRLPTRFWQYVATIGVLSCGVAAFPLLAFHAQRSGLFSDAQVPILFAVAMAVDGAAGLIFGRVYDKRGPQVLLAVPVAAACAAIAFTDNVTAVWVGVAVWGIVNGVLDSTVKAVVTELVPANIRAIAFGWLALLRGVALLIAGALLGAAYDVSPHVTIAVILVANGISFFALLAVLRRIHLPPRAPSLQHSTDIEG